MATALPRLRTLRTVVSCRWDTGGDGHRQIMAKHGVGVEPPLFCLDFWDPKYPKIIVFVEGTACTQFQCGPGRASAE